MRLCLSSVGFVYAQRLGETEVPTLSSSRSAAQRAKNLCSNRPLNTHMLLRELFLPVNEENPQVAGYELVDTRHLYQRAEERGINPAIITSMLKRLGRVKAAIEEYGVFPGLRIYDSVNDVYIVIKQVQDTQKLKLVTTHRTDPEGPNTAKQPTVRIR